MIPLIKASAAQVAIEAEIKARPRFAARAYKQKQKIRENNTSGIEGVNWHKAAQKWAVVVSIKGKKTYLGLYADKQLAAQAVKMKINLNKTKDK